MVGTLERVIDEYCDDQIGIRSPITEGSPMSDASDERPDSHLDDVDDGCGCAEVWEHLSENRESASD
ncbi:MAG: hypothetical protein ABEJ86_06395 [Halococcoides sp.]